MKIVLLSSDPDLLAEWRGEVVSSAGPEANIVAVRDSLENSLVRVRRENPQLLVVAVQGTAQELSWLDALTSEHTGMNVVLLAHNDAPAFLLDAMRAGVREVLPLPYASGAVSESVQRLVRRLGLGQVGSAAQVWAFVPVHGGAGATFIATNLAYALASQLDRRVILIDLNLPFGEAEVYVSSEAAQHCLADVTEKTDRLDEAMLSSVLHKAHPRLGILATGDQLERSVGITSEQIGAVINLATQMADYVFIDVNATLTGVGLAALDRADRVVPVMEATFPAVRNAKRMADLFRRLGYGRDKIQPLINRYNGAGQITPEDVSKALDLKVWQVLPDRAEVASSAVNQGIPVLEWRSRDPLSRQLVQMANDMQMGDAQSGTSDKNSEPVNRGLVESLRTSLNRFKRGNAV